MPVAEAVHWTGLCGVTGVRLGARVRAGIHLFAGYVIPGDFSIGKKRCYGSRFPYSALVVCCSSLFPLLWFGFNFRFHSRALIQSVPNRGISRIAISRRVPSLFEQRRVEFILCLSINGRDSNPEFCIFHSTKLIVPISFPPKARSMIMFENRLLSPYYIDSCYCESCDIKMKYLKRQLEVLQTLLSRDVDLTYTPTPVCSHLKV